MEKQFVTYPIALSFKELGFNEPCMARFTAQKDLVTSGCYTDSDPIMLAVCNSDIHESNIAAPLWQQVIDWLRTEHNIIIIIAPYLDVAAENNEDERLWNFIFFTKDHNGEYYDSYEECREAAILEAIKIVKGN